MSSWSASLGSFLLLAATVGCGGSREPPIPQEDGGLPQGTNAGGGQGGDPSTGGNGTGGTPSTGGMGTGGVPSTGGMGGMGMGGMGGAPPTVNEVEFMYPFCGCITDMHEPGACSNCIPSTVDPLLPMPACGMQDGDCAAGCQAMYAALANCDAFSDTSCLQTIYEMAPLEWDDLVALVSCQCGACPAPDQCDSAACE